MKNKFVTYAFLVFVLSMILISLTRHFPSVPMPKPSNDTILISKTDTVWDTVEVVKYKPIPKKVEVIKYDTVYQDNDTVVSLPIENKVYEDTIICKNDTAMIAISMSGIKSNIDSINLRLKKSNVIITNTKIITKKKGGLRIVPNVSVGYGMITRKIDIYVGAGIGYVF